LIDIRPSLIILIGWYTVGQHSYFGRAVVFAQKNAELEGCICHLIDDLQMKAEMKSVVM
jgi:hypothetical protein